MPFNSSIPQANDRLAKSQQDLLGNNKQLDTSFGINHYAFSDVTSFNGMHKQCQLVEQPSAPNPVISTDSLYTFVTPQPLGELFFQRGSGGPPNTPIQLTNGDIFPLTNNYTPQAGGGPVGTKFNAGATFLPGGLFYQYGTFKAVLVLSAISGTIKFLRTFTNAASVVVTISPICKTTGTSDRRTISVKDGSITTTQFQYNFDSASADYVGFTWTAVGN